MRVLIPIISGILLFLTSCGSVNLGKMRPEYQGVDPRVQSLVDEYHALAKLHGVRFYNKVSIGFKKINHGNVVGVCNYGGFFREIDIDIDYWNNSTPTARLSLVFHELTHCYCERIHDYAAGRTYPENSFERLHEAVLWKLVGGERPGFWSDGCPQSLMFPVVVDTHCVNAHYQEYISEMFARCEAW
jgi:hypothetical protein